MSTDTPTLRLQGRVSLAFKLVQGKRKRLAELQMEQALMTTRQGYAQWQTRINTVSSDLASLEAEYDALCSELAGRTVVY